MVPQPVRPLDACGDRKATATESSAGRSSTTKVAVPAAECCRRLKEAIAETREFGHGRKTEFVRW